MPLRVLRAAFAALFLPAIVIAGIGLSVVEANAEEIRSLPKVYLWLGCGFAALWLACIPILLLATQRRLEWAARALVVLGVNIMVWDAFRTLWLASWLHVAVFAVLEVAGLVAIAKLLRRFDTSTLLAYAGGFAVLQIAVLAGLHLQRMDWRLVAGALRDILVVAEDRPAHHPDPWTRLPDGATEVPGALDPANHRWASGATSGGSTRLRFAADGPSQRPFGSIPIVLDAPLGAPAVAEIALRVERGSVRVGVRSDASGTWFYRRDLHPIAPSASAEGGGGAQTVYVPIFAGAPSGVAIDVVATESQPVVEVDAMRLYRLPARLGDVPGARHGNVYQILLDAAHDDTYVELAHEHPELRFPGFTLYPDFHTTAAATLWSLPSILSSTVYDPATGVSALQWAEGAYQTGLHAALHRAGVPIYDYAFHRYWCYQQADFCFTTQDYRAEILEHVADTFVVDFVFLRVLPNSVRAVLIESPSRPRPTRDSWDVGFSLTNQLHTSAKDSPLDAFLKTGDFVINVFTVPYFQEMMAEETLRPAAGQYLFFHVMLPHGPFLWDDQCRIIPRAMRTPDNAAARERSQNFCAYDLVRRFLANLKALGRYDDATIIVHSDHGTPKPPASVEGFDQDRSDTWPEWYVEGASSGLLMIKWPHATESSASDVPVSSLDLAPTILHHLDVPIPDAFLGRPIQTMHADLERTKVFYGQDGRSNPNADQLSKYVKTGDAWLFEGRVPTRPDAAASN